MSEAIFAIVVSGVDKSDFLSLLPPLKEIGSSSSFPWPDCDECSIAIAECDGFILAAGRLLELIGEGLALEASRKSSALYLCENPEADQYCAAKFIKKRPAGRVEVSSGDIIDDSMGMFEADSEDNDDKYFGQINTHELLGNFTGRGLPKVDWTHYENQ
jgi:hypothetical protein